MIATSEHDAADDQGATKPLHRLEPVILEGPACQGGEEGLQCEQQRDVRRRDGGRAGAHRLRVRGAAVTRARRSRSKRSRATRDSAAFAFFAAAVKVHDSANEFFKRRQPVPPELLQQAEQVTSGIFSCYSALSDDAAQPGEPPLGEWLQSSAGMPPCSDQCSGLS